MSTISIVALVVLALVAFNFLLLKISCGKCSSYKHLPKERRKYKNLLYLNNNKTNNNEKFI